MEKYNAISTHINIDILKCFETSNGMKVKAVDLLPIVAAPIFYLDDTEDVSMRAPIFQFVKTIQHKKALPYLSYTKEGLIDAVLFRHVVNLDEDEIERLLTGIKIISGFDAEGNVILDEVRCKPYIDLKQNSNYKPLVYGGTKSFKVSDNENLAVIHKLLDYPPFNGLRIWSWKCEPNDYVNGYPLELCCVEQNEWFDRSLKDVESFEQFKNMRGDDGHKGTVTRAWWDFAHIIKEGDIVLYRDWRNDLIVGVGRFEGDYMYRPEKTNFRSCRKVNWLTTKHYPSPTHVGEGNTSPMEINDVKKLKGILPIVVEAMKDNGMM